MKVTFEYGVDFMKLPLPPPTIENCRKCAFFQDGKAPGRGCIRTDTRICQTGRNGYFTKYYMREVIDTMPHAEGARRECVDIHEPDQWGP
jgi:hypothetical protein